LSTFFKDNCLIRQSQGYWNGHISSQIPRASESFFASSSLKSRVQQNLTIVHNPITPFSSQNAERASSSPVCDSELYHRRLVVQPATERPTPRHAACCKLRSSNRASAEGRGNAAHLAIDAQAELTEVGLSMEAHMPQTWTSKAVFADIGGCLMRHSAG
jgi:hypothetical protein